MRLQFKEFTQEEKDILLRHKEMAKSSLDTIADYLVNTDEVTEEWREFIQDETLWNYYEVIPKGNRLCPQEIELEFNVEIPDGQSIPKVFKKNAQVASQAILAIISSKLLKRQRHLTQQATHLSGSELEEVTHHLQQIDLFIQMCSLIKISSQLLIAEIACLHYAIKVQQTAEQSIEKQNSLDYIKFKHFINEMIKAVKAHSVFSNNASSIEDFSRKDVMNTRRKFNAMFTKAKEHYQILSREGLVKPMDDFSEQSYLEAHLKAMQTLFFTKNDVNYTYPLKED